MNIAANTHTLNLIESNVLTLESAISVLRSLPEDKYSHTEAPIFEASLGKHIRHVIDHYLSFERDIIKGSVDYDQRKRDTQLELDKEYAIKRIKDVQQWLHALRHEASSNQRLEVVICSNVNIPDGAVSGSSITRELQFLQSHSIHHFALIAIMLRFYGLVVPREFGIAPSTLVHEETVKVSA